jgi:hypothetical protein
MSILILHHHFFYGALIRLRIYKLMPLVSRRRPDDFSYAMAIGDSITAGAFLRGIQTNVLKSFSEWRGQSYAGGGDPGAITVPNVSTQI